MMIYIRSITKIYMYNMSCFFFILLLSKPLPPLDKELGRRGGAGEHIYFDIKTTFCLKLQWCV